MASSPRDDVSRGFLTSFVRWLDPLVAEAVNVDVVGRDITRGDIARGYNELAKLRVATLEETDYAARGVGTAYLMQYLPQRALSVAIGLRLAGIGLADDLRVLDVGSGTGATSLALAGCGIRAEVVAIEPSAEMAAAADAVESVAGCPAIHIPGSLESLADALPEAPRFDLVVLSAVLPYEVSPSYVQAAILGLGSWLTPGGKLLAIEPQAKADYLHHLYRAASARGIGARMHSSLAFEIPPLSLKAVDATLTEIALSTEFRQAITPAGEVLTGPPGATQPIESWSTRPDFYLILKATEGGDWGPVPVQPGAGPHRGIRAALRRPFPRRSRPIPPEDAVAMVRIPHRRRRWRWFRRWFG